MSTTGNGRSAASEKQTIIEEGSELSGALVAQTTVLVRGLLKGELTGPALVVAATGTVEGKAKVGTLRSQGILGGTFDADEVELDGTIRDGTVIRARSVSVPVSSREKPATVFGACTLEIGEAPSKEIAVSAAMAALKAVVPEKAAVVEDAAVVASPVAKAPSGPTAAPVVALAASVPVAPDA